MPAPSLRPARGLDADSAARLLEEVAHGLEQEERDGERRGRLHLSGRRLEEVGAGEESDPRGAADVVERLQLAGLEDDLEESGVAARWQSSPKKRARGVGTGRGNQRGGPASGRGSSGVGRMTDAISSTLPTPSIMQ